MKKIHLVAIMWFAFVVFGVLATITEWFLFGALSFIMGLGSSFVTGAYLIDEWDNFK